MYFLKPIEQGLDVRFLAGRRRSNRAAIFTLDIGRFAACPAKPYMKIMRHPDLTNSHGFRKRRIALAKPLTERLS